MRNNMTVNRCRGYTLVEIMVALAIIAVLGAVSVIAYGEYTAKAKAVDIVTQYEALRTRAATVLSNRTVEKCDDVQMMLNGRHPVGSSHAALGYDFVKIADKAYRPVLAVCGKADAGRDAVRVARAAHDSLARQASAMEKDAVLTDSVVSFALRLTEGDQAVCRTPVSNPVSPCDAAGAAQAKAHKAAYDQKKADLQALQRAPQAPPPGQAPSLKQAAPVVAPPDPGQAPAPGLLPMKAPSLRQPTVAVAPPAPVQQRVPTPRPAEPAAHPAQCTLVDPATGRPAAFPPGSTYESKTDANPNPNPLPSKAPGSECIVCGDPNKGTPCSDLDLVLAITAVCPDDKPFCGNRVINDGGVIKEYRMCVDNARVTAGLEKNKALGGACLKQLGPGQPIGECDAFCYGDLCNSDTNPNSGLRVTQCQ